MPKSRWKWREVTKGKTVYLEGVMCAKDRLYDFWKADKILVTYIGATWVRTRFEDDVPTRS